MQRFRLSAIALLILAAAPAAARDNSGGAEGGGIGTTPVSSPAELVQALLNDMESVAQTGVPWVVRNAQTAQQRAYFRQVVRRVQDKNYMLPYTGPQVPPEDFIAFLIRFYEVGLNWSSENGGYSGQRRFLLQMTPDVFPLTEYYRIEKGKVLTAAEIQRFEDNREYLMLYDEFGSVMHEQASSALLELQVLLELVFEAGPPGTDFNDALMTTIRSMGSDYGKPPEPAGPEEDRTIYVSPNFGPATVIPDYVPAERGEANGEADAQSDPGPANGFYMAPSVSYHIELNPSKKKPDPADTAIQSFNDLDPFNPDGSAKYCWYSLAECEFIEAIERAILQSEYIPSSARRSNRSVQPDRVNLGTAAFRPFGGTF